MKAITPHILSLCFIQVRDNVMQDQFNEYIKSKGKEPDEITAEEKAELEAKMAGDLFPGQLSITTIILISTNIYSKLLQGLDKDPGLLANLMTAANPDKAAEADVLVSGGFDPCKYEASTHLLIYEATSFQRGADVLS